jgi:RHS repeat-associated protein
MATVGAVVSVVVFPLAAFAGGGGGGGRPIDYRRWIVSSSLGSGVLELSEIGDRIQAKIFRPFGEEAAAVGVATYFGTKFAGHRKENNSNLYYMNARWMDAAAGRFVSVDPLVASIVRPQSLNGYSYVENNPISGIDPTGRSAEWNPRHWLLVHNPESSSKVSAADAENDGGGGASSGSGSPGVDIGVGTPAPPGTAAPARDLEAGNPVKMVAPGAAPAPQGGRDPWQGVEVFPTIYPDSHRKFVAVQYRMDATMGRMRASLSNGPSVEAASGGFVGGPGVFSAPPAPTSSVDIAGKALARAGAAAFTGPADPLMLGVIGGAFVLQGLVFGGLAVGTAVVGAPIIAGTTALGLGVLGAAFVVSGAIDIELAIRLSGEAR